MCQNLGQLNLSLLHCSFQVATTLWSQTLFKGDSYENLIYFWTSMGITITTELHMTSLDYSKVCLGQLWLKSVLFGP